MDPSFCSLAELLMAGERVLLLREQKLIPRESFITTGRHVFNCKLRLCTLTLNLLFCAMSFVTMAYTVFCGIIFNAERKKSRHCKMQSKRSWHPIVQINVSFIVNIHSLQARG